MRPGQGLNVSTHELCQAPARFLIGKQDPEGAVGRGVGGVVRRRAIGGAVVLDGPSQLRVWGLLVGGGVGAGVIEWGSCGLVRLDHNVADGMN